MALGLTHCKTSIKSQLPDQRIPGEVREKLGNDIESFDSPNGQYVLYLQKQKPTEQVIKFVIIERVDQKLVLEKSFRPGYVKWIGDTFIEILDAPGVIRENENLEDYKRIINVAMPKK